MKQCYFNSQNEHKIATGTVTKCPNLVGDDDYLCPDHKYPGGVGRTLAEKLAAVKKNYAKKRKPIKMMSVLELGKYRDELKTWLEKNDTHPKYQQGLDKLEEVYNELKYRNVVNLDA